MTNNLDRVKTVVVVMMENRSFDNLLGYLSLQPNGRKDVDGLQSDPKWLEEVSSVYQGNRYPPFELDDPYDVMDADPPHERGPIAVQMGQKAADKFAMDGFVTNYANAPGAKPITPAKPAPVMGYFTAKHAPVTDFFAQHFAIFDHWFSSLPAGTQPNRLMAMSGYSNIEVNQVPLPEQELVYDWLERHGVRWRVYHEDMPFFAMMTKWIPDVLNEGHFRPFKQLLNDIENEPPDEFPEVIFIEPTYTDAPHLGMSSDDHAPSAIKGGQQFLEEVYRCMMQSPDFFAGLFMIITYDEHGGFFDHVSPPSVRTDPPPGINYPAFESLGVRVPAFVISPFVKPGSVCNEVLDHTSILKFIGEKFGKNGSYSDLVDKRPIGSITKVLTESGSRPAPAIPSLVTYLQEDTQSAGFVVGAVPSTPIQQGFQDALDTMRDHPDRPPEKFAHLLNQFPPLPRSGQG